MQAGSDYTRAGNGYEALAVSQLGQSYPPKTRTPFRDFFNDSAMALDRRRPPAGFDDGWSRVSASVAPYAAPHTPPNTCEIEKAVFVVRGGASCGALGTEQAHQSEHHTLPQSFERKLDGAFGRVGRGQRFFHLAHRAHRGVCKAALSSKRCDRLPFSGV